MREKQFQRVNLRRMPYDAGVRPENPKKENIDTEIKWRRNQKVFIPDVFQFYTVKNKIRHKASQKDHGDIQHQHHPSWQVT